MKIKMDESRVLEFKIDTSNGCELEDLQGYLRFNLAGVEYGFPAKVEEGQFKVEVPAFQNVVNSKLTESISKNKELIVKGRLDVIANKNAYIVPWQGEIDIEIPIEMNVSEGDEILAPKKKITVDDPDSGNLMDAFNEIFEDKEKKVDESSKLKDLLKVEVEVKEENKEEKKDLGSKYKCKPCGWVYDPVKQGKPFSEWDGPCPECDAPKSKFEKVEKVKEERKSKFAQSLEKVT